MASINEHGSGLQKELQTENLQTLVVAHRLIRSFMEGNFLGVRDGDKPSIPPEVQTALQYADSYTPRMASRTYVKLIRRHEREVDEARQMVDIRQAMLSGAASVETAALFSTMLVEAQANLRLLETRGLTGGGPGDAMLLELPREDPGEQALREVMGDE